MVDGVEEFYSPLDYKTLKLKQYVQIVKYPMDLGTIKVRLAIEYCVRLQSRLDDSMYESTFDVQFDIEAIWNACITYNGVDRIALLMISSLNTRYR